MWPISASEARASLCSLRSDWLQTLMNKSGFLQVSSLTEMLTSNPAPDDLNRFNDISQLPSQSNLHSQYHLFSFSPGRSLLHALAHQHIRESISCLICCHADLMIWRTRYFHFIPLPACRAVELHTSTRGCASAYISTLINWLVRDKQEHIIWYQYGTLFIAAAASSLTKLVWPDIAAQGQIRQGNVGLWRKGKVLRFCSASSCHIDCSLADVLSAAARVTTGITSLLLGQVARSPLATQGTTPWIYQGRADDTRHKDSKSSFAHRPDSRDLSTTPSKPEGQWSVSGMGQWFGWHAQLRIGMESEKCISKPLWKFSYGNRWAQPRGRAEACMRILLHWLIGFPFGHRSATEMQHIFHCLFSRLFDWGSCFLCALAVRPHLLLRPPRPSPATQDISLHTSNRRTGNISFKPSYIQLRSIASNFAALHCIILD